MNNYILLEPFVPGLICLIAPGLIFNNANRHRARKKRAAVKKILTLLKIMASAESGQNILHIHESILDIMERDSIPFSAIQPPKDAKALFELACKGHKRYIDLIEALQEEEIFAQIDKLREKGRHMPVQAFRKEVRRLGDAYDSSFLFIEECKREHDEFCKAYEQRNLLQRLGDAYSRSVRSLKERTTHEQATRVKVSKPPTLETAVLNTAK